MKTRFVVLLAVVITGRFGRGRAGDGGREGWRLNLARRILGTADDDGGGGGQGGQRGDGATGKKTPDGTSEGTVSRFTSGRLPNGDTPRSGLMNEPRGK